MAGTPNDVAMNAVHALIKAQPKEVLYPVAQWREAAGKLGLKGEAFDKAALSLFRSEKVGLHFHDHPSSLDADHRAKLVSDEYGNTFHQVYLSGRTSV